MTDPATDPVTGAASDSVSETDAGGMGRRVGSNLALGLVNNLTLRFGNVLLGIVLARLLAPEDFGVFAVALTVQAVLANLTDLGMTAYVVRTDDVERRAPTVLALGTLVGIVLAAVMAALGGVLATQLGSPDATRVIQVLSLTLVLSGIGSVPTALLQRRFQQGKQLIADLSSFAVNAVVVLVLIQAGMGAMALAWARVAGQLVAVALLFVFSRYRARFGFNRVIGREAYTFGLPLVGANVLSWVLINLDYVLVGRALGATALGFYVLAFNVASWPTQAISQALRAVALPAFTRVQAADAETRTHYTGAASALALAAAAPAGAVLLALSSPVVAALYGERWARSAAPLAALAAFGAVRPVFDLLATYLTARGATRPVLVVQIVWTVTLLPAMAIGIHWGGLTGAGLAHLAVGLVIVWPGYLWALHREGQNVLRVLRACVVPVLAALAAGGAALVGLLIPGSPWFSLLGGGAAAALVYVALLYRWLRRTFAGLREAAAPPEEPPSEAPVTNPIPVVVEA